MLIWAAAEEGSQRWLDQCFEEKYFVSLILKKCILRIKKLIARVVFVSFVLLILASDLSGLTGDAISQHAGLFLWVLRTRTDPPVGSGPLPVSHLAAPHDLLKAHWSFRSSLPKAVSVGLVAIWKRLMTGLMASSVSSVSMLFFFLAYEITFFFFEECEPSMALSLCAVSPPLLCAPYISHLVHLSCSQRGSSWVSTPHRWSPSCPSSFCFCYHGALWEGSGLSPSCLLNQSWVLEKTTSQWLHNKWSSK